MYNRRPICRYRSPHINNKTKRIPKIIYNPFQKMGHYKKGEGPRQKRTPSKKRGAAKTKKPIKLKT